MNTIDRRRFLRLSAMGAAVVAGGGCVRPQPGQTEAVTIQPTGQPEPQENAEPVQPESVGAPLPSDGEGPTLAEGMGLAASRLLTSLDPAQRTRATYGFGDEERFRWHWTTPGRVPRNGLALRDMSAEQKSHAHALLEASLSPRGYARAVDIISLQRDLGNDPDLYYITLFGSPSEDEPWGWRWEGHHLSHHFTIRDNRIAMTPFFLGSWPTTTDAGLRAMEREEDAALELANSLLASQREALLFQDRTLTRHVTQNAARVAPLEPVGVAHGDMTGPQQALVAEIIGTYLGNLPQDVSAPALARIDSAGFDLVRFGWAGSLEYRRPQYYRLQGPTFLLEFDNSRNGGTHIHSVWRDFEGDFGRHLL